MKAQETFRAKHSRSASRGLNSPIVAKREHSESRRREVAEVTDTLPPPAAHGRAVSTEHAGDLRQMKDERQRKKEQAARELEERRKSLAKRPQAPQIPHPNDFNPAMMRIGVETSEPKDGYSDMPPRCATEPPKSMYARSGPHIGLPATPKAMRMIMEAENNSRAGKDKPEVPPVPVTFSQRHSPNTSPDNEKGPEPLTLLPSTVYQPPQRPAIPRSMSAPIPDEPGPARYGRKASVGEIRGIDEVVGGERRRSHEEPAPPPPPPPPPAPPMLKELQHLAIPPPPPPAPLPHARRSHNQGAVSSGMIEIVMDEDDNAPVAAPNDGMVPLLPPPAPPSRGHTRGRSSGDGSISGRFSKATERFRSASRGHKDAGRSIRVPSMDVPLENNPMPVGQLRSPVAAAMPPPVMYDTDVIRSPLDLKGKHMSTGLHRSEMI